MDASHLVVERTNNKKALLGEIQLKLNFIFAIQNKIHPNYAGGIINVVSISKSGWNLKRKSGVSLLVKYR